MWPKRMRHHLSGGSSIVATLFVVIMMFVLAVLIAPDSAVAPTSQSGARLDSNAGVATTRGTLSSIREAYQAVVPHALRLWVWQVCTSPVLYTAVPLVLLLEYVIPCRPGQALFSVGFFHDAVWFALRLLLDPLLLGAAFVLSQAVYDDYLSVLTVQLAQSWPLPVQILVGVVLSDFLIWLGHVAVHKLAVPWAFHAVHHAQEEINVFTDDRAHWFDLLFRHAATFVLLFMFQVLAIPTVAAITAFRGIHQRLVHANVQMNFGILGYVLVSPQFHRVHHSKEPHHQDKNFGVLLSVWDHLFGTAYRAASEYPATGISDPVFPRNVQGRKSGILWTVGREIIYPFRQLLRDGLKGRLRLFAGP